MMFKEMEKVLMNYNDLDINQKITIKGIISDKRYRDGLSEESHIFFDGLKFISKIDKDYITAVNIFLDKMVNNVEHSPFYSPFA